MPTDFGTPPIETLVVTQKNELAYAAYEMTVQEKRLLLLPVARLTKANIDFPFWEIPVAQIAEFLGIQQEHVYRDIKKVAINLMGRVAVIPEPDNGYTLIQFVSRCRYVPASQHPSHQAVLEIKLHDEMAPYLLALKDHFQSIQFEALAGLSSFYAMRLYEILHHKRNEQGGEHNIIALSLSELRKMLQLEKKYSNYKDFRLNVLEPAREQMCARTPLGMSYKELRARSRGAPVKAIEFTVWDQTGHNDLPPLSQQMLMDWGEKSREEQIAEIYKSFEKYMDAAAFRGLVHKLMREGRTLDFIRMNLETVAVQIAKNPEQVRNVVKYCIAAVRENYAKV
jgi:plasmid replication initiation protein